MEIAKLMEDIGLPPNTTIEVLKAQLAEGKTAAAELQTAKTNIADLTAFKTGAEPVLTARKGEASRLMGILHDGKPPEYLVKSLDMQTPEQLEKTIGELTGQIEKLLPMKCMDCGGTNISGRSSIEEPKDKNAPESAKEKREATIFVKCN